ncbi:RT0821/Lpp0805 family surface protein [Zobellella endophytica]|nr:RT0821/Lpp0805 family surface protein [Zobellella endophytica]
MRKTRGGFGLLLPVLVAGCGATGMGSGTPLYLAMTDGDVAQADRAVQRALETAPSETPIGWYNQDSGNSGSITPLDTYVSRSGHYCRHYRERLVLGEHSESYLDTACRNGDGIWIPVPTPAP